MKSENGMSLLAILGFHPTQNLTKYKRWLCVLIQLTNSNIVITQFVHSQ